MRKADEGNPQFSAEYAGIYSDRDMQYLRDAYRQYVDYSVLVMMAAYALNVVDATVFAPLRQFDISDDLNMRITPTLIDNRAIGICVNISISGTQKKISRLGLTII